MKKFYILAALFFAGIFYANAQDIIILRDGNTIEAKVTEISPTEIRYRRFSNLNGPVIVIPRSTVLSIRYENGETEIISGAPAPTVAPAPRPSPTPAPAAAAQAPEPVYPTDVIFCMDGTNIPVTVLEITDSGVRYSKPGFNGQTAFIPNGQVQSVRYLSGETVVINEAPPLANTVLDPRKKTFGMSFDPAGFLRGGPSASMEWTKGNSNTLLFLSLPTLAMNSLEKGNFGMGFGLTINYYKPTEKGGFFIGPTIEYNLSKLPEPLMRYKNSSEWEAKEMKYINDFVLGANIGYKFVRESGAYFRIGIAGGLKLSSRPNEIYPARDYSDGKEVSEWVSYNNPYDPEGGYYTMRTQNGIVGTKKSVPAAFFYKPSVTVGYIFK